MIKCLIVGLLLLFVSVHSTPEFDSGNSCELIAATKICRRTTALCAKLRRLCRLVTGTTPTPIAGPETSLVFSTEQREKIKQRCRRNPNLCKPRINGQRTRAAVERAQVRAQLQTTTTKTEQQLRRDVHDTADLVYQAKEATLRREGLDNIIRPSNDGLWAGDIMLTQSQARAIIDSNDDVTDSLPGRRARRHAIMFEQETVKQWQMPIDYHMEDKFTAAQKTVIREAIAEIESKTCIRFRENQKQNENRAESYIMFFAVQLRGSCGQAHLGKKLGVNTIMLNFKCVKTIKGNTIHEVLHTLGVDHHHSRYDRDEFIKIDENAIKPNLIPMFEPVDSQKYTSYGIPYDYYSIMHYSSKAGAVDKTVPTIIPTKQPEFYTAVLGQRVGLSDGDTRLLQKMYCSPDCWDTHVWCGWWATHGYCEDDRYFSWMANRCSKSCGACPHKVVVQVSDPS